MARGAVSFQIQEAQGIRPVMLLFAPSERSPAYENQMSLFSDDGMLEELDALLVRIFAEGTSYVGADRMDDASVETLRTGYQVEEHEFLIVFIDRDGRELHRSDAPVQASVILERFSNGSRRDSTLF